MTFIFAYFIVLLLLMTIRLVDWRAPERMPAMLVYTRFWATCLIPPIVFLAFLFWLGLETGAMFALVGLSPVLVLFVQFARGRKSYGFVLAPLFALLGFPFLWDLATTGGFGLMMMAYHQVFPWVVIIGCLTLAFTAPLFLLEPGAYFRLQVLPRNWRRSGPAAALALLVAGLGVWLFFIASVGYQARALAEGAGWCLQDGNDNRTRRVLDLVPSQVLLLNRHETVIRPYLLLRVDGHGWDHHWSFRSGGFVEHEDPAPFQQARNFFRPPSEDTDCGNKD